MVLETTALPTELYPCMTVNQVRLKPLHRNGGEDGIRTHAALANPNDLANRPLQPLEYFSRLNVIIFGVLPNDNLRSAFWRRGWDSNPRPLTESLVFKTSSLNHSDTSPHASATSPCLLFQMTPSLFDGDPSEIRTPDTLIKSQVLCQLS